jgi:hypothetical protein
VTALTVPFERECYQGWKAKTVTEAGLEEADMRFSDAVVGELAAVWARLHRSAARHHLEFLIRQMEGSGDPDGAANYSRVLAAVMARAKRGAAGDDAEAGIDSPRAVGVAR